MKVKISRGAFPSVLFFSLTAEAAFAYIDPGTGAVVVGSVWPLIAAALSAAAALAVKRFWSPLKSHAGRVFGSRRRKGND